MIDEVTVIKVSIEAMISFALALFVPSCGAAWALGRALIFNPLTSMKSEISKLAHSIEAVTLRQLESELKLRSQVEVLEVRLSRLELEKQRALQLGSD